MKRKTAKIVLGVGVLILCLLTPNLLLAQMATATLSGTIVGSSGTVVPNAKISIKNVETGQATETQSNAAGIYNVPNLASGDYAVSVSAKGLGTKVTKVMLIGGNGQTLDVALSAGPEQQAIPANKSPETPPANLPNAPSSTLGNAPSLGDLGFSSTQTQGSAQQQALLNKRTHMLKVHQTLGLITVIPLAATLITGPQAKAKGKNGQTITEPTSANLDFHIALGGLTTGLYWTTAYYAIFAPKVPGVKPKGAIRLHRDLNQSHKHLRVEFRGILELLCVYHRKRRWQDAGS